MPVLASLRAKFPEASIDWLVQDSFADAIRAHPALSGVVPFRRRELGRSSSRLNFGPTLAFLRSLRRERYDLVVDAQGLLRSSIFARATGAPRRVGFADARELGWLLLTEKHRVQAVHTVDRMLGLVEAAGVPALRDMRLYVPPQSLEELAPELRRAAPYVVLAPTSRWPGKQWPAERFAVVASDLTARGLNCVIVGSASEREQISPVLDLARRNPRVLDRVGGTSIAQLMAWISRAALVIANDSAALHMAVGFDRPIVALFGPTDVAKVGPYQREGSVLQRLVPGDTMDHKDDDIGQRIMARITTTDVLDMAREQLRGVLPSAV
ncbi:MAG: glycosyltransferase family 9 protein [Planctomycetota bacterium]|nr:glycosyltransferase family 9 protein [Planctomycetota bacterium]